MALSFFPEEQKIILSFLSRKCFQSCRLYRGQERPEKGTTRSYSSETLNLEEPFLSPHQIFLIKDTCAFAT